MLSSFKRITLTFVFFYFATMMIVMGNGGSFLGRYLSPFFIPVANSIGLNTTWNFFSPDPAHTMYFHYFIIFEDGYGNTTKETIESYYPESKDLGGDFRLDKKRHSYAMRFLAIDFSRVGQFFVPWKCRENPEATKIQVEMVVNRIPAIETVMTLKDENYDDLVKPEEVNRMIYDCQRS